MERADYINLLNDARSALKELCTAAYEVDEDEDLGGNWVYDYSRMNTAAQEEAINICLDELEKRLQNETPSDIRPVR